MATRKTTSNATDEWVQEIESSMRGFSARHGAQFRYTDRQMSGAFEIGCFLKLVQDYEQQFEVDLEVANLTSEKEYRYLTSPTGDPHNFSFIKGRTDSTSWELRQQVRVRSYLDDDIYFTPDIVVIRSDADLSASKDDDFARGKKKFFFTRSEHVIAMHECKSMSGFPELYVSFLGLLWAAHPWATDPKVALQSDSTGHFAPTLFVGGEASNLHRRMVRALEAKLPLNIMTGLHRRERRRVPEDELRLRRIPFEAVAPARAGRQKKRRRKRQPPN